MSELRNKLIRLAHTNSKLRPDLLPLLKEAATIERRPGSIWLQDAPEAVINGRPTYGPLPDRVYTLLNRRQKWDMVGMANNSRQVGMAKAVVNGKKTNVIYFRATNGSAEGIAWDSGMNVYRIRDPELSVRLPLPELGQLWAADTSRKGLRVQSALTVDPVTQIEGVKATFETTDDGNKTSLQISLRLNTAEKLANQVFENWLQKNWRSVISKAPNRKPHDGKWLAPSEMSFEWLNDDLGSPVWVRQTGDKALLIVDQTVRIFPRVATRFEELKQWRQEAKRSQPQPISQSRAREIMQCQRSGGFGGKPLEDCMTQGEFKYMNDLWDTLPGNYSQVDVLNYLIKGRALSKADILRKVVKSAAMRPTPRELQGLYDILKQMEADIRNGKPMPSKPYIRGLLDQVAKLRTSHPTWAATISKTIQEIKSNSQTVTVIDMSALQPIKSDLAYQYLNTMVRG